MGVAAVGAAMSGAAITVVDADAATADLTATAGSDGSYSVDVTNLRAPFLVRASATVNGEAVTHLSVVATVTANADNTANVTPFTTAIATLVAPGSDVAALGTAATLASAATATTVSNATALVVNTLRTDAGTAALLPTGFNPLSTSFAANGTGIDAALVRVEVATSSSGVTLTNTTAAAGDNGAPAGVTLTASAVATPAVVPTLPASPASGDIPTVAELDALGAKIQACYAQTVAQRVTMNASGTVTAVSTACTFTPADWRSNGRSFVEDHGQFTLKYNIVTGARVGSASIAAAFAPEGLTAANEFKHPYCNTGACVIARFPIIMASGKQFLSLWVVGKVAGQWNFVGNQKPFDYTVSTRLTRLQGLNPAPTSSTTYFNTDRVESLLRTTFSLAQGDTSDLRAVRVTGSGIPTGGLVFFRSQACGMEDRMSLVIQNGSTRNAGVPTGALGIWTTTTATSLFLAAAKLDGSALAMHVLNAYGGTSAPGDAWGPQRSGTELSPVTATLGSNPNPRCAVQGLTAMSTSTADYREAGLSFRGADRQFRQSIWFWRN